MALTNEDLSAIAALLQPINNRLDRVESRLDRLESDVSALKAGQIEHQKKLNEVNQKVSDTYEPAFEAWGKSTENRIWIKKAICQSDIS